MLNLVCLWLTRNKCVLVPVVVADPALPLHTGVWTTHTVESRAISGSLSDHNTVYLGH